MLSKLSYKARFSKKRKKERKKEIRRSHLKCFCPDHLNCLFFLSFCFSGVRVFIPNFVQIDELDYKQNLMKIENAGVSYPMGK